ncbi:MULTISPECIES: PH domain-containing protein [Virgibacillus]|uniref:Bacterial membrane flanked domain protein n=1 Tax=Virgibacillus dokdonensis TaxID=302167 RepID=A0A2K9J520_9BACI|nr:MULTISPECIES: PH domain-containing protein [Virgibacillus]AUJ25111.1 Bacterial membrane flanked domain protein [Virgibacillus dokdonensis]NWO14476.1 PH domain-containing protein [Virgibacillus sp.]
MRHPPKQQIEKEAIKVWRITAAIYNGILCLLAIAALVVSIIFEWPVWYSMVAVAVTIILAYVFIFILPKLRWRRWRYELFEQEIYIQYGILIMSRTLVPMVRVQHVDTQQGPILKRYDLATVTISTAATTHEIPALNEEDASLLRDRISELARVDEEDV